MEGCCCCNDCNYFKNGRMEPILRPNEANSNDVMIIYEDHLDTTNAAVSLWKVVVVVMTVTTSKTVGWNPFYDQMKRIAMM